jgi:TRAP-type C4-dicarboxylate transport system substrate-binding protein
LDHNYDHGNNLNFASEAEESGRKPVSPLELRETHISSEAGKARSVDKELTARVCRFLALGFSVLLIALGTALQAQAAPPAHEIKLATMAPENSTLMQVFNEMNAELLKETGGKVGFKMFPGFVLGDEEDVLRKLRIGLVHAGVFTTTALTDINPDLRGIQVPFMFNTYGEVDYVTEKLDADFKRGFSERGFEILGWPELGFIYFMSTTPVAGLEDLKGKRVWAKANAPMSQAIIERAGVATVAINTPDVLMALQTNLLDVVYNSPYYALVTQWNTQIKYFTDLPLTYIGGALMIDKKVYAKLPPPMQETLKRVCGSHLRRLTERTRKDNADALELILKKGVKKITPDGAQVEGFKKLSDSAMNDLGPKFLPPDVLAKIKTWLAEYRSRPQAK